MLVGLAALGLASSAHPRSITGSEVERVVTLVRENYASYASRVADFPAEGWAAFEREILAAPDDEISIKRYLAAFGDPFLAYWRSSPRRIARRIRFGGGPQLADIDLLTGTVRPKPQPLSTPAEAFGAEWFSHQTTVVLDARRAETAPRLVAALGLFVRRGSVVEPGIELRASEGNLAYWRQNPAGFPAPAETIARITPRPRWIVALPMRRKVVADPLDSPVRIAILVGPRTDPDVARFVTLARQDARVRVFGSPTGPIGPSGLRPIRLDSGATLDVPTLRSPDAPRVLPDEDVASLPAEMLARPIDYALLRADRWCRLGQ